MMEKTTKNKCIIDFFFIELTEIKTLDGDVIANFFSRYLEYYDIRRKL